MDCGYFVGKRPDVKLHSTTLCRLCIDISSCNFKSFEEMLSVPHALPDFTADLKELVSKSRFRLMLDIVGVTRYMNWCWLII